MGDKYATQKKHLATQKQVRVWVNPEKYEAFKEKASSEGTSIYALVNQWISQYLQEKPGE